MNLWDKGKTGTDRYKRLTGESEGFMKELERRKGEALERGRRKKEREREARRGAGEGGG